MCNDFETTEEIYKYLLAGGTLINNSIDDIFNKSLVKLIDGFLITKTIDGSWRKDTWNFNIPKRWSKYKEPKWFENIPKEGILCWVSRFGSEGGYFIARISRYNKDSTSLSELNSKGELIISYQLDRVKPLTKEELKVFYDNSK